VFNTLSKRSAMTGYRSGFVCAPEPICDALRSFRPTVGTAPQEFVQHASVAAWADDAHVDGIRALYRHKREALLPLAEQFNDEGIFVSTFMVSAVKGDGLGAVMDWCVAQVPEGTWLYPADQAADTPSRLLAAEITREKIYLRLHDELPYATMVQTDAWDERKDGSIRIDQTIYVQREGQKAIALGKGGATIKEISAASRTDLETILGRRVHLFLHVKVRENWADTREFYAELGLEFPTE